MKIMKKVKYWGAILKKDQNDKFPGQILLIELHSDNIGGEEASHHPTISAQGEELGSFFSNFQTKHGKSFTFLALGSGICEISTMRFAKIFWAKILKEKLC